MAGLNRQLTLWFGIDGVRLRALLALRLKLMVRQFMRQPGQLGSIIFFVVILGPLVIALATFTAIGYRNAPGAWPINLVAVVLTALWVAWIALPLLAFRTNEGLDLERLLVFPLRTRELVVSTVIGTLLDWSTLISLPFFLAMLVGACEEHNIITAHSLVAGDRIRCARMADEPGVFHLDFPAALLFANFEAVSKQVTFLHYSDDIGLIFDQVALRPVSTFASAV